MSYDWKQLGAKIAKVGLTFLATGGVAAIGGAAPATILLAGLTGEAIAGGLGEIAEGIVSGIQPKEKGVYTRFQLAIKNCVAEQLKKTDCPRGKTKDIQSEIMDNLFGFPVNAIVAATAEPQKVTSFIKNAFSNQGLETIMSEEKAIIFVDALFSRLVNLIDNDHEFTTTVYLKSLVSNVQLLQITADETLRVSEGNDEKLNRLIDLLNDTLNHSKIDSGQLAPVLEKPKYSFIFEIGLNGQALEFSTDTKNAIREWFYDCAREDLSSITDECLEDTFKVTIVDERVTQAQIEIEAIDSQINSGEILDVFGEHRYSESKKTAHHINKENDIKAAAIKFYLNDRIGFGIFNTFEHYKLTEIIVAILELPYFSTYELDNNRDYIMLEVYLNFSGYNENHERFTAHMKRFDVNDCFGGTGIYDVYGYGVCDMGKYRKVIAPYFYQHLGNLKVTDNYDFSQNKRILNLYNYYVGLH